MSIMQKLTKLSLALNTLANLFIAVSAQLLLYASVLLTASLPIIRILIVIIVNY